MSTSLSPVSMTCLCPTTFHTMLLWQQLLPQYIAQGQELITPSIKPRTWTYPHTRKHLYPITIILQPSKVAKD